MPAQFTDGTVRHQRKSTSCLWVSNLLKLMRKWMHERGRGESIKCLYVWIRDWIHCVKGKFRWRVFPHKTGTVTKVNSRVANGIVSSWVESGGGRGKGKVFSMLELHCCRAVHLELTRFQTIRSYQQCLVVSIEDNMFSLPLVIR